MNHLYVYIDIYVYICATVYAIYFAFIRLYFTYERIVNAEIINYKKDSRDNKRTLRIT